MQKIVFPYHGESSEETDVKIFCRLLTAMQMSSVNREKTSLAKARPTEEDAQLFQLMIH